jgi:hypothetical protein
VVWEIIFMMVILKIPIAYLCAVVWWAIKAEPRPPEGAAVTARIEPDPSPERAGHRALRPRRPRPGPQRRDVRRPRAAPARAKARR